MLEAEKKMMISEALSDDDTGGVKRAARAIESNCTSWREMTPVRRNLNERLTFHPLLDCIDIDSLNIQQSSLNTPSQFASDRRQMISSR